MFAGWEGDLRGSQNPAILTMDAHKNVKAVFKPDPNAPRLLSQGRRVTVSSEEKGGFTGDKAVDGRLQTRWSTAFSDPQWICVDLGKEMRIEAVQLHWETACASRYELQTSNDGKKWTVLHAQNNGQGQVEEISGLNGLGRYVRLWGLERATDWGYSLWEFEVYGRDAQANDMPER